MNAIRKISVGVDPKNSMHYIVGKPMGEFIVKHVVLDDNGYTKVYASSLNDPDKVYPWKTFNPNVPITFEHYIEIQ